MKSMKRRLFRVPSKKLHHNKCVLLYVFIFGVCEKKFTGSIKYYTD